MPAANFARFPLRPTAVAVLFALGTGLAACTGGGGTDATSTGNGGKPAAFDPLSAADFKVSGVVATGKLQAGLSVQVFDSTGKACGQAQTSTDGTYSIDGNCSFPLTIAATTPEGEGTQLYTFIPTIEKNGQSFKANLTPITSAITTLALNRLPLGWVGAPTTSGATRTLLTKERLNQSVSKMHEVLDPLLLPFGAQADDFMSSTITPGQGQDAFMDMATFTFERVPSTKQSYVRIHLATEHRPVTLVVTDSAGIKDAVVDPGLGMALHDVNSARMKDNLALVKEVQGFLEGSASKAANSLDRCYMHNGIATADALFDVPNPLWLDAYLAGAANHSISNVQVQRVNTYTDFTNETLEHTNFGGGDLVFASFDFKNVQGFRQRGYTWLIKGTQSVGNCMSSGTGWRILGNQRPVYLNTTTYALHQITYNQQFGTRTDEYGTGTEHYIHDYFTPAQYEAALVSGPGLPSDGRIFLKIDGAFLICNPAVKLQTIRLENGPDVTDKCLDSRAAAMTDPEVRQITDAFYDLQNRYTYRFFKNAREDLYPSLTVVDVLPKRPHLNTEIPVEFFPTLSVNLDNLVTAMQTGDGVPLNWSLPKDLREQSMVPNKTWFNRFACRDDKLWPKCNKRSQQYNEYDLSTVWFDNPVQMSFTNSPVAPPRYRTVLARALVKNVDSLNRPVITSVAMDYRR